jgi:hypothetical protein
VKDFLKSAPSVLALGSSNESRAKRKRPNLSDDSEPEDNDTSQQEALYSVTGMRGTLLITLRDSLPYTLWYDRCQEPWFFRI